MFLFILGIQHAHDNECWYPFLYTRRVIVTDCAQHGKLETCHFLINSKYFCDIRNTVTYYTCCTLGIHGIIRQCVFIFQNVS